MSDFKPVDELERLVMKKDSQGIVFAVLNGARLTRVDVFGEKEAFQLTVDAALVLAFIGLPKSMRKEAVDFVRKKCGKDSDIYDFLAVEYRLSEKGKKPKPGEKKLLAAIKKKDNELIYELCKDKDCTIYNDLPNEYIPCISALMPAARMTLFKTNGLYMRVMVLLLQQLMTPETGEPVPPEVASLGTEERYGLIRELIKCVAWKDHSAYRDFNNEGFEVDIVKFRGRVLKYFIDKSKSWGMYDLWNNKIGSGSRNWQDEAFNSAVELLTDLGIRFKAWKRKKRIAFQIPIPREDKMLDYTIVLQRASMVVFTDLPYVCPRAKFADLLEYFNFVNSDLATCTFLLERRSRRCNASMRMKSNFAYSEHIDFPAALCYDMIASHLRILEQFSDGLECVIAGEKTPDDAYEIAHDSIYSNMCDWYDDTQSSLMIYNFPGKDND